jgi:DNA-binding CsgD family transcriptional regulator/N-acetylneuraminic acid mutarotase
MIGTENSELSERELEILRLVATGVSNKEIAQKLFISTNTVKVHLRNIFAKVGAASRTEAALYAVRMGIVENPSIGLADENESADLSIAGKETTQASEPVTQLSAKGLFRVLGIVGVLVIVALLFVVRGANPLNPFSVLSNSPSEDLSIEEQRWRNLAELPTPRINFASAVYESHLYAIAGESSTGIIGQVDRYSFEGDVWEMVSPKPVPVSEVSAAVIGGLIYVPGGRRLSGELTDVLEVYDPRQDNWEKRAALPLPLSGYALVAHEGRLYLFGGWNGQRYVDTVYTYDPGQDRWEKMSAMPTARGFAGAVSASGKINIIGGYDGAHALSVHEIYFPDRDKEGDNPWMVGEPLPEGRYSFGVASVADTLQVVGGVGNGQEVITVLAYQPQTDSWQVVSESPSKNWAHFGFVTWGPYWFIQGGKIDGVFTGQNVSYQALFTISLPIVR